MLYIVLEENGFFNIRHRNTQALATEIFKFLNGLSPQTINEVFQVKLPAPCYLMEKMNYIVEIPKQ